MSSVKIGGELMRECERCGGLWVEVAVFNRICVDREKQSIVLGGASIARNLKRKLPARLKPFVTFRARNAET